MSDLPQLSASQVSTFRDCARKWAFSYIELRKPPAHPSAELGTKIHAELEAWLKAGTLPTHPSALAGMPHAPAPGVPWVEHAFTLELPASPFRGFIDVLYDLDGDGTAILPFTGNATVIQDWKSSSDPKKWAKTPAQLRVDVQSNLYAGWAFSRGASRVQGRWIYLATKGMSVAHPVHLTFDRAQVSDQLGLVNETASVIQTLYQLRPKTSELPPTRESCGKFGGCPYRADCPQSMEDLFGGEKTVSNPYAAFMSDVDSRFGSANMPAPVVQPPPIYAQPPAPVQVQPTPVQVPQAQVAPRPAYWMPGDEMNDTQKYLVSAKAPLSMIANAAQVPPPPDVAQSYDQPRPPVERGFINPPEAPTTAPAQPSEMPVVPETVSQDQAPVVAADDLDAMERDALKVLGVSLGAFDDSCRKQAPWMRDEIRRVRKTGVSVPALFPGFTPAPIAPAVQAARNTPPVAWTTSTVNGAMIPAGTPYAPPPVAWTAPPAPAVLPPVVAPAAPAFVQASPADALRPNDRHGMVPAPIQALVEAAQRLEARETGVVIGPGTLQERHGLELFINCSPKHYTGLYFADVLRAVLPKVRELGGVQDWREVDYGKGAALLSNTVRTFLLEQHVTELVVDSRTPEGGACLGVLEELASNVTRGF